jgi:transketolase
VVLVATGSEVGVAVEGKKLLAAGGVDCRVVSMPSLTAFWKQPASYRNSVVPQDGTPVVVIEAGIGMGWNELTRSQFLFIGMNRFGASAPAETLAEKFGFTGPKVAEKVSTWLKELKEQKK